MQPYATEPIRIFYLREWNVLACSLPCSTLTARRCIQCVGLFMDDLYRASPVKQINNTLLWAEKGVMGIDAGVEMGNFVWLVAQISPWKLGFKAISLCLFSTRRQPTTAHDTVRHVTVPNSSHSASPTGINLWMLFMEPRRRPVRNPAINNIHRCSPCHCEWLYRYLGRPVMADLN